MHIASEDLRLLVEGDEDAGAGVQVAVAEGGEGVDEGGHERSCGGAAPAVEGVAADEVSQRREPASLEHGARLVQPASQLAAQRREGALPRLIHARHDLDLLGATHAEQLADLVIGEGGEPVCIQRSRNVPATGGTARASCV